MYANADIKSLIRSIGSMKPDRKVRNTKKKVTTTSVILSFLIMTDKSIPKNTNVLARSTTMRSVGRA